MAANDSKPHLPYLNKIVDQHNNTYHHSINKKPINAVYSALTEKIEMSPKTPKFKMNDRVVVVNRGTWHIYPSNKQISLPHYHDPHFYTILKCFKHLKKNYKNFNYLYTSTHFYTILNI